MGDFSSWNISVSYVHIVVNLFWDYLLGCCVQVKENVLTAIKGGFIHTVNHYNIGWSNPDGIVALNICVVFNYCALVNSRNGIDGIRNTPSDNGTVTFLTYGDKFFSPMIIFMIHMEVNQAMLWDILAFIQFEFISHGDKFGGIEQGVVKIISLKDFIWIKWLYLIDRDWEIFKGHSRYWACKNRLRT